MARKQLALLFIFLSAAWSTVWSAACGEGVDGAAARSAYEAASALTRSGRLEPAARELARALEHDPAYVEALLLNGAVLERLDRLEEAEHAFRSAARLAPDHPDPPLHLARVARMKGLDQGIEAARRSLAAAGDRGPAHRALADLLLERRRAEPARLHYVRALRHDPDDANAHSGLAVALVGVRRHVSGLYHASAALELKPRDTRALGEFVWVLATSSESTLRSPELAIERAEAATRKTSRVLDGLAAAYAAVGRTEDAVTTARAAIEAATQEQAHARARAIQQRLALYETGGRFIGPPIDPG